MEKKLLDTPLSFMRIVLLARFIFAKNTKNLLFITLLFCVPMTVAIYFIPPYLYDAALKFTELYLNGQAEAVAYTDPALWSNSILYTTIKFSITAFFSAFAMGAATHVTKRTLQGGAAALPEIIDVTAARLWKYLLTNFILSSVIFSSVFLVAPAIFFSVAFYFSSNVIADTGEWGFSVFRRSYALVRGRWFKTLSFAVAIGFLEIAIRTLFVPGAGFLTTMLFGAVSGYLCLFFSICISVLYFNLITVKASGDGQGDINA